MAKRGDNNLINVLFYGNISDVSIEVVDNFITCLQHMMCLSTKALTLHTLPVQSSAFDPKLSQYDANLSLLEQVIPNIYVSCISV